MPITAQSADGRLHVFPDTTAPDVIDRAMKQYATAAAADQPGMLSTIGSEIGGQFMAGVNKVGAAFNPLSEENRAINKQERDSGFFDPSPTLERGKLLAGGLEGIAQAAGSVITGPVRALGAPAIQSLDVPMRAATRVVFGRDANVPPELTHDQAADVAESLLAGIAPRGGVKAVPHAPGAPKAPELDDIFASSNAHYEKLKELSVPLRSDVVADLATSIKNNLEADAFYKEDQPRTFRSLERLIGEGESSSKHVYAVRTALGRVLTDLPGTSDAAAAGRAIERLDEYLSNIPEFAETAKAARQDWASAKTSQMVQELEHKAQRAAAGSGSGANLDNATRQQIKSLLNDKKRVGRLSEEEKELAEEIVKGGTIGNMARILSKLGPKHPLTGWGSALAADLTGGGGAATGSLGVGAIAQWLAEKLTTGKIRRLDEMIRSRSALAQTASGASPVAPPAAPRGSPGLGDPELESMFDPRPLGQGKYQVVKTADGMSIVVMPTEGGKHLHIESVVGGEGNFGPAGVRRAMEDLQARFPDAETIGGRRIGGARLQSGTENKNVRMSLPRPESDVSGASTAALGNAGSSISPGAADALNQPGAPQ